MQIDPFQSPASIVVFVVCLYCTILFVLSWCGWRQLAWKYAAESKPAGTIYRGVSGWANLLSSYRNCLNAVVSPLGIYVETQIFFRLFHRPLFFPWECVSEVDPNAGILWTYTRLTFGEGFLSFRLLLPERALGEVRSFVPAVLIRQG